MPTYCGTDFHARQQVIAWCDTTNGEIHNTQLKHQSQEEVRQFYKELPQPVIVGLEASGYSSWFEKLLTNLGCEIWIGNATEIRARARARQKTDRRDAELLLDLLLKGEFPRVHRPSLESMEVLRQLRYRHNLVKHRTMIKNSLQALALGAGLSRQTKLLTKTGRKKLMELELSPAQQNQRATWLELLELFDKRITLVEQPLELVAQADPRVERVRTHPGIGLLSGLALVHTLCPVTRFDNSRKVVAYVGLEPREYSSGERQRFGSISKQGSRLLRFLLGEAAKSNIHRKGGDPQLKRLYSRVQHRRDKAKATVAAARHLLVHAFVMLRDEIDYAEFCRRGVAVESARTKHRPQVPGV